MSHTTKLSSGNHAIHNGDFEGDITIVDKSVEHVIPASDFKELVAEMIKSKKIAEFEQMNTDELLGLVAT